MLGILLAGVVLCSGRLIRHALLIGPQGRWRDELWLDDFLPAVAAEESDREEKQPRLVSPLPINTCSRDSLTLLPGVGPVLAERIDEARRRQGGFASLDDLRTVKGIGPVLAARLESLLVFSAVPVPVPVQNTP